MTTLSKAILAGSGVALLLVYAVASFRRTKHLWAGLLCLGGILWLIVVATHVAEALHLWPWMRWGERTSPGHYLDLGTAVLGLVLVTVGCVLAWANRWANPARSRHESRR